MIVIIPAAGNATRMRPLSNNMSKAMIPVNGKPIISYIIDHLEETVKPTQYVFVENEFQDISKFVSRAYPNLNSNYVIQENKNGPLDAIHTGWKYINDYEDVKDEPILVWLGDTICLEKFDYRESFYGVSEVDEFSRWCLIDKDNNTYDKPESKPPTSLALIGVYYFHNRSKFDICMWIYENTKKSYEISSLIESYKGDIDFSGSINSKLIKTKEWYDCGELNSYYESKSRLISRSARSFNNIQTDTFYNIITKFAEGKDKEKIEKEKAWFKRLTEKQAMFCPRILSSDYGEMRMSLETGTALNDVYVYENLRKDIWFQIIDKILRVHLEVFMEEPNDEERKYLHFQLRNMYFVKFRDRISSLFWSNLIPEIKQETPNLETFIEDTFKGLEVGAVLTRCMHGDSHLGNIIYEPNNGSIKFLDPRGSFGKINGNGGDINYDIAKLLQDFYCGYCFIQAKKFSINEYDLLTIHWNENHLEILQYFEKRLEEIGFDVKLMKRLSALLLLTAIPFNQDKDIIKAMYIQSMNLIKELQN